MTGEDKVPQDGERLKTAERIRYISQYISQEDITRLLLMFEERKDCSECTNAFIAVSRQ